MQHARDRPKCARSRSTMTTMADGTAAVRIAEFDVAWRPTEDRAWWKAGRRVRPPGRLRRAGRRTSRPVERQMWLHWWQPNWPAFGKRHRPSTDRSHIKSNMCWMSKHWGLPHQLYRKAGVKTGLRRDKLSFHNFTGNYSVNFSPKCV